MSHEIEQEIRAKGLTAPRITPADVENNIVSEYYFTADQGAEHEAYALGNESQKRPVSLQLLTFCVLIMRNGFTVTGESSCASPENFDAEIGRKIARENAVNKIWPLMGYELRSKLSMGDMEHRMLLKTIPQQIIAEMCAEDSAILGLIESCK